MAVVAAVVAAGLVAGRLVGRPVVALAAGARRRWLGGR